MGACQDSPKVIDQLVTEDEQFHLKNHYKNLLTFDKRKTFENQLNKGKVDRVLKIYKKSSYSSGARLQRMNSNSTEPNSSNNQFVQIPEEFIATRENILSRKQELDRIGLNAIKEGKAAIILMAGGQSPQLNLDCSLGTYDIGLDCAYSLFEIFVKKLHRLCTLSGSQNIKVKLYIMANEENKEDIKDHFKNKNYFGYGKENIFFFSQECAAVVNQNGKIVLKNQGIIQMAPRGNGQLYLELKQKNLIPHIESHGIEYVILSPINNALLKIGDPTSLGYLILEQKQIVASAVKCSEQSFGYFGLDSEDRVKVFEDRIAHPQKKWANSGGCLMTLTFLKKITEDEKFLNQIEHKLHDVVKQCTAYDPSKNTKILSKCLLFESFYHEAFKLSNSISIIQLNGEQQFAPIQDQNKHSILAARDAIWNLHGKYVINTGATVQGQGHIEIHPSLTYEGQGVAEVLSNKKMGIIEMPLFLF